ncbi:hypothetical protein ACWHLZ_18975 [Streptomyces chartreusis]|uniref:hypothetical protein n=1 Tax=Streptomyces chartreusis TaxID=1969 RepID=UPI00381608D6|nr:hypothetical protein OG938_11720 [Streptomyces chartreusis]WTA30686.1 hypothetical protein OIA45_33690 [Streptomyces chartreusis]
MRERQLSNGCGHRDALQGNFPVHDEALSRVAAGGVDGLDTLLSRLARCWSGRPSSTTTAAA